MAITELNNWEYCASVFEKGILKNLHYWSEHTAIETLDIVALDQEKEGIFNAISYGLQLTSAWPALHPLITNVSPYMERRGYWLEWRNILNQAFDIARHLGDLEVEKTLSVFIARTAQRQKQYRASIQSYRNVLRLARSTGDEFEKARAYSNLSFLFIERGFWSRAEILGLNALEIFERIQSNHGLAHTENHIGLLYIKQGKWDKAKKHLEHACNLWESMLDKHGLMLGFINLGLLYNEIEHCSDAIRYLEAAKTLANQTGDDAIMAIILMNLGIAHRISGKPEDAVVFAQDAQAIFKKYSNLHEYERARGNLALAYLDLHEFNKAYELLQASIKICQQLNDTYGEIRAHVYLTEYYCSQDFYDEASKQLNFAEGLIDGQTRREQFLPLHAIISKYRYNISTAKQAP